MTGPAAVPSRVGSDVRPLWQAREHLPVVASWLWREWGRDRGYALKETREWLSEFAVAGRRQTGRAALKGNEPLGVALLCDSDLDSRTDLSPWLTSLYVVTSARGCGIGSRLVREIELAAIEREVSILYLYTLDYRGFYAKRGWTVMERLRLADGEASVMCKKLV